jgi:arylsulfatase A-like enzyme
MRGIMRVAVFSLILYLCHGPAALFSHAAPDPRPNIVVIITDDQGYGDLGIHGNPKINTPHLDEFSKQSVRLKNFYVSPVCAPTRASLLTGRYNYRTGVVDTYLGRAMMHPNEVTLAEMLAAAGYRTGIFGKWHLGDNAPLRPIDQGFQQSLVIKGGGIGQPSDPPGGSSYFDPILQRNGKPDRIKGYCSDIFAQAAGEFIRMPDDRPFFAYLAFNCPHEPLLAPEPELASYRAMNLALKEFPQLGHPIPAGFDAPAELVARVYAMVTNIDTNVGKVLKALDEKEVAGNTIVVFLTDNGPAHVRFNAGLRGRKGSVYDGGIHVPCYIRWPGHLRSGGVVDRIAAHIDLAPTLLDACGVHAPAAVHFDGKSLLPLLTGIQTAGWPDRTLFFQWHRGDRPEPGRAFAARSQTHKLVRHEPLPGAPKVPPLELYDMDRDPLELHDIANEHSEIVSRMHSDYKAWFKDVSSARGFEPVRIALGSPRENPTILTRQDWRGPRADATPNALGFWEVEVAESARYQITLHVAPRPFPSLAHVAFGTRKVEQALAPGQSECSFTGVELPAGPGRLEAWIAGNDATAGVLDMTVRRLPD